MAEKSRQCRLDPGTGRRIKIYKSTFLKLMKKCGNDFEEVDSKSSSSRSKSTDVESTRLTWFSTRKAIHRAISSMLKRKRVSDRSNPNFCMTGHPLDFVESFSSVEEIGRGSFGKVYLGELDGFPIVVKEQNLEADDLENINDRDPREVQLMTMTNELLKGDSSPHFPFVYDIALCDSCEYGQKCFLTFMEPADGTLSDLNGELTWLQQESALQQCLLGIDALHSQLGIFHFDIKRANVLLKIIPHGGFFEYVIGTDTFFIKNEGFLCMLTDFGLAKCFKPKFFPDNLEFGTRNAVVLPSKKLKPITCKFSAEKEDYILFCKRFQLTGPIVRTWDNGKYYGTYNLFTREFDLKPDVEVNLNNTRRFPAQEFFKDIQECMHMFYEDEFDKLDNLSPYLKNLIISRCLRDFFPYTTDAIRFLVAVEMLKEVYVQIPRPKKILATFQTS